MNKTTGHVYDKKRKHCLNVPGKGMLASTAKRGKLYDENDFDDEELELLYKIK